MSFEKLWAACLILDQKTWYHEWVHDWDAKRKSLIVLIHDFPYLLAMYKGRQQFPVRPGNEIITVDATPLIRLQSACEAATNTLYGMSEIAAQFANKASKGILPSSFNALRKNAREGKLNFDLVAALGDLQWYEKVRELRTEWAHYSTVFIGEDNGEPLLVVKAYRSKADRAQFKTRLECSIPEIIEWVTNAIATIDGFATYLLKAYVLPGFNMDAVMDFPILDAYGLPLIRNAQFAGTEKMTIREHLQKAGVIDRPEA